MGGQITRNTLYGKDFEIKDTFSIIYKYSTNNPQIQSILIYSSL